MTTKEPIYSQDVCRTCLISKDENSMKSIFKSELLSVSIAQMLMHIAPIDVQKDDNLPDTLCLSCFTKLKESYAFQRLCIDSDSSLRNKLSMERVIHTVTPKVRNDQAPSTLEKSSSTASKPQPRTMEIDHFGMIDDNTVIISDQEYTSDISSDSSKSSSIKFTSATRELRSTKPMLSTIDHSHCKENKTVSKPKNNVSLVKISKPSEISTSSNPKTLSMGDIIAQAEKSSSEEGLKVDTPKISSKTFNCKFCKSFYSTWNDLANHIGEHKIKNTGDNTSNAGSTADNCEGSQTQTHKCNFCGKVYSTKEFLNGHMNEHIVETKPQLLKLEMIGKGSLDEPGSKKIKIESVAENCSIDASNALTKDNSKVVDIENAPEKLVDDSVDLTNQLNAAHPNECEMNVEKGDLETSHSNIHPLSLNDESKQVKLSNICDKCGWKAERFSKLHRHYRAKHSEFYEDFITEKKEAGKDVIKCSDCNRYIFSNRSYQTHISLFHSTKRAEPKDKDGIRCHECNQTFSSNSHKRLHVLYKHQSIRLGKNKKQYKCLVCDKRFITPNDLYDHERNALHTASQSTTRIVATSESAFETQLKNATSTTSIKQSHPCVICDENFESWKFLQRHMEEQHKKRNRKQVVQLDVSPITSFRCKKCDKCLDDERSLKAHMKTAHHVQKNEKPKRQYRCLDCCKKKITPVFLSKTEFDKHAQRVHKELYEKRLEKRAASEGDLVCKVCLRRFRIKEYFQNHVNKHYVLADEIPNRTMHPCKLCSGIFGDNRDLKNHYVTSHGFESDLFS